MNANMESTLTPAQQQMVQGIAAAQTLGTLLLSVAILSVVLPAIGLQIRIVSFVQHFVPHAGWWMAGVGAFFLLVARIRSSQVEAEINRTQAKS